MAVFNGYPATYQQMYQPYQYAPLQNQPQSSAQNGIIWVTGEAGAKAYLVAPNNTVQLWDSESQVIYLKSADASGMPSMKVLDYTIRDSGKTAPSAPLQDVTDKLSGYATKDDLKGISEEISALKSKVESMTRRRARVDDDE